LLCAITGDSSDHARRTTQDPNDQEIDPLIRFFWIPLRQVFSPAYGKRWRGYCEDGVGLCKKRKHPAEISQNPAVSVGSAGQVFSQFRRTALESDTEQPCCASEIGSIHRPWHCNGQSFTLTILAKQIAALILN